jgi:glutamate-ammonia-ligase adenylyltransferase
MNQKRAPRIPSDPLKHSRFARSLLTAQPQLKCELAAEGPWTPGAMREFVAGQPQETEPQLHAVLRQLRQRVMLRLLARDLLRKADLAEVCATTTALAEVTIQSALVWLEPRLEADLGVPASEKGERQRLIVVGMGKLGGGELNVSSDVDLIFIYPEEGETRGASAGHHGAGPVHETGGQEHGSRSLSNHEFFTRLGRRLIAALAEPTADGQVFRVDMRLRPWGDAGPLAASLDALEQYLVAQGREWERYAWIKGRALTGETADERWNPQDDRGWNAQSDSGWNARSDSGWNARSALGAIVRPFVYRKYLDFGAFAAMRDLHAQIRAEVARRDLADHIKLGPGGIREIEFIAQAFQLIRGGRDAGLQVRPTLRVLALLAERRILPGDAAAQLAEAYVFLRELEHRLQYLDDAQTHTLPRDEADRALVAESMGFASWEAFSAGLDAHRERVSRQFEQIFSSQETPRHALASLWQDGQDELVGAGTGAEKRLEALGFRSSADLAARLRAIRGSARYADLPEASRNRFDLLVPRLIELAAARGNPDATLERCLTLIETISRRAAYLALLDEHPQALAKLAELVSASSWASEYLNRHPVVLDELLDARVVTDEPDWRDFGNALRTQMMAFAGDPERQMDLLREAHHAQSFRLLVQDLAGHQTVERLADHLSDLADCVLQVTLELCWTQIRTRHCEFPRFAVIAYGKLGGKELGYASDLDIIFLHDDPHEAAPENYSKLAARINNWLNARTGAGVLFETDLRLRPDGAAGLLVSSVDAFRHYQRQSAWVWEHQALTRARCCAGDATVGALFEDTRREILSVPRDPGKLRDEVLAMRQQMLEGHPNKSALFDLKHDRGGMVDIEFIVQYLVLAHSSRHMGLTANDGNIALLGLAADLGLIPRDLSDAVRDAYRDYRRRQHGLRLNGARYARVPHEEVGARIEATRALWRAVFGTDTPES